MRSILLDHPTINPLTTPSEGPIPMYEPLHQNLDVLTRDRIDDLYATARELRQARHDACERVGLLFRTRLTLGRRLISLGHSVAGQAF